MKKSWTFYNIILVWRQNFILVAQLYPKQYLILQNCVFSQTFNPNLLISYTDISAISVTCCNSARQCWQYWASVWLISPERLFVPTHRPPLQPSIIKSPPIVDTPSLRDGMLQSSSSSSITTRGTIPKLSLSMLFSIKARSENLLKSIQTVSGGLPWTQLL